MLQGPRKRGVAMEQVVRMVGEISVKLAVKGEVWSVKSLKGGLRSVLYNGMA